MRRGFTLLELLVSLTMTALITAGVAGLWRAGLDFQLRSEERRLTDSDTDGFESRLGRWLRSAYLDPDTGNEASYFIASSGQPQNANLTGDIDTLTFTAIGLAPSSAYQNSDLEFDDLNFEFGPVGGVAEVTLSPEPFGSTSQTGLFLRRQVPADSEPTQGGRERLFDSRISSVTYEFFDGLNWTTEWDTRTSAERRLPAAVRVRYRLEGDNSDRIFVVRIPNSDVTPEDPITEATQ